MQEALPYKRWAAASLPPAVVPNNIGDGGAMAAESLVKENPVVIFGTRGCFLCHVVRKLLLGLGVNSPVFEIDSEEGIFVNSLVSNNEGKLQFPLVFVGGELFGGLDKVMATHLSGELIPVLKKAGALWL